MSQTASTARRQPPAVSHTPDRGGGDIAGVARPGLDPASTRWLERLRVSDPRHDETVRRLHDVLRLIAFYELSRRRHQLGSLRRPEFDDLAQQATDDALVNVLGKLDDFRGLSRFTTWAYSFVIFEVSAKIARHAWRRQPPDVESSTGTGSPKAASVLRAGGRLAVFWNADHPRADLAEAFGEAYRRVTPDSLVARC